MLEFKNVSVTLPHGEMSTPFSMLLSGGEMACLCGPVGSGKSLLLRAVMGLAPVASGYITVDGELVTSGSASYFRRIIAYVPQHLPDTRMKVSELCQSVFNLQVNRDVKFTKETLMKVWYQLGIDESAYALQVSELEQQTLQLVLLSLLPLLKRPVILIDNMLQTQETFRLLRGLAAEGAEVLYTCEDNLIPCDKLIKL
jgi:ABC-type cobalamin/Fe3+-siderophores transport system ATPase subunit